MAFGEVINSTAGDVTELPTGLIFSLGQIALWLSAAGVIIILWIIFQVVTLIVNRKKRKALYKIKEDTERIDKKADGIELMLKSPRN